MSIPTMLTSSRASHVESPPPTRDGVRARESSRESARESARTSFAAELSVARTPRDVQPTIATPNAIALREATSLSPRSVEPNTPPEWRELPLDAPQSLPDSADLALLPEPDPFGGPRQEEAGAVIIANTDVSPSTVAAQQLLALLPFAALPAALIPYSLPDTPSGSPGGVGDARDARGASDANGARDASGATDTARASDIASGSPLLRSTAPTTVGGATHNTIEQTDNEAVGNDHFDASAEALQAPHIASGAIAVQGSDPRALHTALARLDPKFRAKLERVIAQMEKRFGHSVAVVETVRSQARQNALFAQGRTAPGPVVTWTKQSKHSEGLAADLKIDGQWSNPVAYAHLAQLAKQEGLRTLGARDPGHVELVDRQTVSAETLDTLIGDLTGESSSAHAARRTIAVGNAAAEAQSALARVASVAQVARVASVATVARVSAVARAGASSENGTNSTNLHASLAFNGGAFMNSPGNANSTATATTPVQSIDLSDRIAHLLDIQAAQDTRPLRSVMLRMQNATGIDDQIRIDTRGTSVDAELGLGNAQHAAELTDRLGELRSALERRGLQADSVHVRRAAATDTAQFTRTSPSGVDIASMRAASDGQLGNGARDHAAREQAARAYDEQRDAQRDAQAREHSREHSREQARHAARLSHDDAPNRSRREPQETRP
jgi:uncharacterized protein YcbK (DUF882 family)